MDIKKILIVDEISDKVIESLRAANFSVDLATDITSQRLLTVIQVSVLYKILTTTQPLLIVSVNPHTHDNLYN